MDGTVVITGAAGGIGRALCGVLGARGFRMHLIDRPECGLHAVADGLGATCQEAVADSADAARRALDTVRGAISGFVHLAGAMEEDPELGDAPQVWSRMMDHNLRNAYDYSTAIAGRLGAVRLMAISNTGGWRNIATTDKAVTKPADVAGLKLRTIPADIQIQLVEALGGSPTPIAWPEVYTSLATGVVDGTKNGITDIVGMQFQDSLKFLVLDGHAYMGALWWINEGNFQALSDEEKRIVFDGFQELKWTARQMPKLKAVDAYQTFRDAGGEIYTPTAEEKKAFQDAAQPVWQWYEDNFGAEWIEAAQSAVADCEVQLDAAFENATR